MLNPDEKHPSQSPGIRSELAKWVLFLGGAVFMVAAIAQVISIAAKDLGYLEGEVSWKSAMIAFFLVLAASECMTANITWWAGQVLRGIAERLSPADK